MGAEVRHVSKGVKQLGKRGTGEKYPNDSAHSIAVRPFLTILYLPSLPRGRTDSSDPVAVFLQERIHALVCQCTGSRCGDDPATRSAALSRRRHKVPQCSSPRAGGEEPVRRLGGGRAGRKEAIYARLPVVPREARTRHQQRAVAGGRKARDCGESADGRVVVLGE
jgi:hypothetical protein